MKTYEVTIKVKVQADDTNQAVYEAALAISRGGRGAVDVKEIAPQVFQD